MEMILWKPRENTIDKATESDKDQSRSRLAFFKN